MHPRGYHRVSALQGTQQRHALPRDGQHAAVASMATLLRCCLSMWSCLGRVLGGLACPLVHALRAGVVLAHHARLQRLCLGRPWHGEHQQARLLVIPAHAGEVTHTTIRCHMLRQCRPVHGRGSKHNQQPATPRTAACQGRTHALRHVQRTAIGVSPGKLPVRCSTTPASRTSAHARCSAGPKRRAAGAASTVWQRGRVRAQRPQCRLTSFRPGDHQGRAARQGTRAGT